MAQTPGLSSGPPAVDWGRPSMDAGGHSASLGCLPVQATAFCTQLDEVERRLHMPVLCPSHCVRSLVAPVLYPHGCYSLPTELRTTTVSSQLNCHFSNVCVHACLGTQSCPTLSDPTDCSPPGSSVHGIFQARILEWLPCPLPGNLPDPGIEPKSLVSPALASKFFTS